MGLEGEVDLDFEYIELICCADVGSKAVFMDLMKEQWEFRDQKAKLKQLLAQKEEQGAKAGGREESKELEGQDL
jgi:hypothetical protein